MIIEALKRVLPPPLDPVCPGTPQEWARAEYELGTRLPSDYKQFITVYGSGSIDDILSVFNACSPDPAKRLSTRAAETIENDEQFRDEFPEFNWPLFPEPGGWLPWGDTTSGNIFYWVTDGDPDDWQVVAAEGHMPEIFRFAGNLVALLEAIMNRRLDCPWLRGRAFPNPAGPKFYPRRKLQ